MLNGIVQMFYVEGFQENFGRANMRYVSLSDAGATLVRVDDRTFEVPTPGTALLFLPLVAALGSTRLCRAGGRTFERSDVH